MALQSLWGGVGVPATTNASDGAPGLTLGTIWRTGIDTGSVHGISWRFPDTLPTGTVTALLYEMTALGTGTLLASKAFSGAVAGQWCSQLFDAPVLVVSGVGYIAAIHTADRYVATASYWDDGPVIIGDLVGIQDGTDPLGLGAIRNGRFEVNGAPTFPTDDSNASNYWVDLLFDDGLANEGALSIAVPALTMALTAEAYMAGALDITLPVPGLALTDADPLDLVLGAPGSPWQLGAPRTGWAVGGPDDSWSIGSPRG